MVLFFFALNFVFFTLTTGIIHINRAQSGGLIKIYISSLSPDNTERYRLRELLMITTGFVLSGDPLLV